MDAVVEIGSRKLTITHHFTCLPTHGTIGYHLNEPKVIVANFSSSLIAECGP